jgi:hypothetical protein
MINYKAYQLNGFILILYYSPGKNSCVPEGYVVVIDKTTDRSGFILLYGGSNPLNSDFVFSVHNLLVEKEKRKHDFKGITESTLRYIMYNEVL